MFGGFKLDILIFYLLKLEIFNGSNFFYNFKVILKIKIKLLVVLCVLNIN